MVQEYNDYWRDVDNYVNMLDNFTQPFSNKIILWNQNFLRHNKSTPQNIELMMWKENRNRQKKEREKNVPCKIMG